MYFDAGDAVFDPRPGSVSFVAGVGGLFTTFFFVFPAPFVGTDWLKSPSWIRFGPYELIRLVILMSE